MGPRNALMIEIAMTMLGLIALLGMRPDTILYFWHWDAAAHGPLVRTAAIIVVVCQCPAGTGSTTRTPRGARPRVRVMSVFSPDSSMNTSRRGSTSLSCACHCSRAAFTSGRSCSAARSDFF